MYCREGIDFWALEQIQEAICLLKDERCLFVTWIMAKRCIRRVWPSRFCDHSRRMALFLMSSCYMSSLSKVSAINIDQQGYTVPFLALVMVALLEACAEASL